MEAKYFEIEKAKNIVKENATLAEEIFQEVYRKRVEKDVLGMLVMDATDPRVINEKDKKIAAKIANDYVKRFDETPAYWGILEELINTIKETA